MHVTQHRYPGTRTRADERKGERSVRKGKKNKRVEEGRKSDTGTAEVNKGTGTEKKRGMKLRESNSGNIN